MDYEKERARLLGEKVVHALETRFFEGYYCASREEACAKVLSLLSPGSTVTWGGTASFAQCGVIEKLKSGPYTVIDRDAVPKEERAETMRKAYFADAYLMSANAISADGCLVNIDGTGNRISALCYGPDSVIVLAGLNKVAPTLDDAIKRARNVAAPINAQRFPMETPCRKTGLCGNCLREDCICAQVCLTRLCRPKGRIKVVLCGEPLGF